MTGFNFLVNYPLMHFKTHCMHAYTPFTILEINASYCIMCVFSLCKSSNSVRPNLEEGLMLFSTLLNNKHFLVTFVHALEQQKDFAVRDR